MSLENKLLRTALLISVEPPVLLSMKNTLSKKFEVETASGLDEALFQIQNHSPDLIVLELKASDVSTIQILRNLRLNPATRKTPILIIASTLNDEKRAEALVAGADDVVSLPILPKELLARIQVRDRSRGTTNLNGETLRCGNLTVIPGRMEVFVDKKIVQLSAIEIALLRLLIVNLGSILSREMILQSVWKDREVTDRVVDYHVVQLRRKLKGFNHQIVSIYGAGYGIRKES